jgi:hypothetical protein
MVGSLQLTPNRFFFPAPTTFGIIGPQLLKLILKLNSLKKVSAAKLLTYVYPDPWGSLALVAGFGLNQPQEEAYETALNIVGPILDELSAKYDQPLPIAHNLMVHIPSGLMTVNQAKTPKKKTIDRHDPILPACPYPQLRSTVALYREGVSSNNPFHQFLTLWKIYENACEVRGKWRREHRRLDTKLRGRNDT